MSYLWTFALLGFLVSIAYPYFDQFGRYSVPKPGQRVVVCGASAGIGEQIAYLYSKAGARVFLAARRKTELSRVASECLRLGAQQVEYAVVDLSTSEAARSLIERSVEAFGGLDVLILNHMILDYLPWSEKSDLAHAEKKVSINFLSYVYLTTHALPALEQSHGRIAVLSSGAGKFPSPYDPIYKATKHALHGFFDSLRMDLRMRHSNISITTIILGLFGTKNVIENTKGRIPRYEQYSDPQDAAMVVVRATTLRTRDVYFPWLKIAGMSTFYHFFPQVVEWFMVYAHENWIN